MPRRSNSQSNESGEAELIIPKADLTNFSNCIPSISPETNISGPPAEEPAYFEQRLELDVMSVESGESKAEESEEPNQDE